MRVIQQEFDLGKLKAKLAEKAAAQKHCKKSRRKERSFLVSLISQYKGKTASLTAISCKEACRRKKVKPLDCRELCEPKVAPCLHLHGDSYNSSTGAWLPSGRTGGSVKSRLARRAVSGAVPHEEKYPWDTGERGSVQRFRVIQLSNLTDCFALSCVSHPNTSRVACLDLSTAARPVSSYASSSRAKPLHKSGYRLCAFILIIETLPYKSVLGSIGRGPFSKLFYLAP
jgi:hypothetical protein